MTMPRTCNAQTDRTYGGFYRHYACGLDRDENGTCPRGHRGDAAAGGTQNG